MWVLKPGTIYFSNVRGAGQSGVSKRKDASIYWTWHGRNARLHRQIFCSKESINAQIDRQIRNRIASFRERNPGLASKLLQLWLSTDSVR
ncbi:unnamed protein product [Microthlaspi erraticum]|uniref:Uncharacterized protein n=1 Tax=Microthlaspi erraticum TaxID=1685480 RepID=A0A6D2IR50_9BRAS|nr:unnamed protein product [Microthlaspi erraticum]